MKNNKRHKDRVLVKKDVCFCIQEIAIHRRLVRSEAAKDPTNCYKCMSYATTEPTHCVFSVDVRSVGIWYGHTMTFSSEHCRRNTQDNHTAPTESKNVCARNTSRGLDYWGLKKQLSKPRLDQNCYDKTWSTRSQVRFVRSGKISSSFGCPLTVDLRKSFKRCWNHRGDYVSIHTHDLFHHELVHQSFNWDDDKEDECVCCCFCVELSPATFCSSPRSLTIFIYWMIFAVLLYWQSDVHALLNFQSSRKFLLTWLKWFVTFFMIIEFVALSSVPAS